MNNFSIYFERPWLMLLLIPALAAAILPILRLPRTRRFTLNRTLSLCLHSLIAIILVCLISGMTFYKTTENTDIIIVADLSDSTADTRSSITSYISSISGHASSENEIGIVAFGNGAVCVAEPDADVDALYSALFSGGYTVDGTASNISDALLYAEELFSEDANKRIILLSDGMQTDGDTTAAALKLAEQGIRVDAIYFNLESDNTNEIQISNLKLPNNSEAGETISVSVTLTSASDCDATIYLYDNDTQAYKENVTVKAGVTQLAIPYECTLSGVHELRLELSASADSVNENNVMYSYVNVKGSGNLLIIDGTGSESTLLSELLSADYNVTVIRASKASDYINSLRMFDEVILMNVSNADLPSGFDEALSNYVEVLGGGVLTTGGDNTYIYGSMTGTEFENLLPIQLVADDTQTVALMVLLDASSSMSGVYLTMAKEGAINCINSLSDTDYVGVIAFNSGAKIISELTSVTNKDSIIKDVEALTTSRGTNMYDAVYEAYSELKNFDADVKHVIIMSDGNPTDSGYAKVVELMTNLGITTSTIAVGSGANTTIMKQLATLGNGRYYEVTMVSDLPDIMLNEAVASQGEYYNEVTFTPQIRSYTTALNGISTLPELNGYISSSVKNDAVMVLYTNDNTPVYARWKYGNGFVGSFMSDLSGYWSSAYYETGEGQLLIRNIVAELLPGSEDVSSLYVTVDKANYSAEVSITADTSDNKSLKVEVLSPSGKETEVTPVETTSGGTATIKTEEAGIYTITVIQYDSNGEMLDYTQKNIAASYSEEYNAFSETDGAAVLTSLCQQTGGKILKTVESLFDVTVRTVEYEIDPSLVLMITCLIMFLADIVARKFKFGKR